MAGAKRLTHLGPQKAAQSQKTLERLVVASLLMTTIRKSKLVMAAAWLHRPTLKDTRVTSHSVPRSCS